MGVAYLHQNIIHRSVIVMCLSHRSRAAYVSVFLMLFCSHSKVLEALTFCSEIRNCERFVPILQGLTIGDVQMRVCLRVVISYTHTHTRLTAPFLGLHR